MGQTLCGATCVDLTASDANCGACGYSCQTITSSACQTSSCTCPATTPDYCGGPTIAHDMWSSSSTSVNAVLKTQPSSSVNGQVFTYLDQSTDMYNVNQSFTFNEVAAQTGTFTFHWTYTGYHAYFNAQAGLTAFTTNATGVVTTQTLVAEAPASGGFAFSGVAQLNLTAGHTYGFTAIGTNYDSANVLQGTLSVESQLACVDLQSDPSNCGTCGVTCGATQACGTGTCLSCNGTLPPGSYLATCSNCLYDSTCTLTCDCLDQTQTPQHTTLGPCGIGIENLNGVLTCCSNC